MEWRRRSPQTAGMLRGTSMRNVLNIEASKIFVPARHVRQGTAHFSSLHPKNLLTSRSEPAAKALVPQNSQVVVVRPCRRIVAGFLVSSIHRRRESSRSNARGCPFGVVSSRHPRSNSLRLACVDAEVEARLRWVEWRAEKSVNGRHAEGCVHEERTQHRSQQDRRPRGTPAPRQRRAGGGTAEQHPEGATAAASGRGSPQRQ